MKDLIKAKLPSSVQAGISDDTYRQLSVNPQCVRLGKECDTPCEIVIDGEYEVQLDHIVPKSLGGSDTIDNLQWLCRCENAAKQNKPDARYSGFMYFDHDIDIEALRKHQLVLGYKKVVQDYRSEYTDPTRIMRRFALLAWLVGAGKTVGMMAILFAINNVRRTLGGGSARRIKRVLWVVHQKALVEQLVDELSSEMTAYGIAPRNPRVVQVTDARKWNYQADIVVACTQALWDAEGRSISDQERAEILGSFDAIVVDEAQFAISHYLSMAKLAPNAFKFAVTATPMDADGNLFCDMDGGAYKDHFALFSVFGYHDGRAAGFYKELLPFDEGKKAGCYLDESGGAAEIRAGDIIETETNTRIPGLPRDVAIVRKARNLAVSDSVSTNFDHHVMVRVGSIIAAQHLVKVLEADGDVVGVWAGQKGPSLGRDTHPWMLAKGKKGRIPARGKRVVVVVDIGQFGINNPYCSLIVWLEPNRSMIELVQRIGRAIRRRDGQDDSRIRVMWNSAHNDFGGSIGQAIDYMLNMETRLDGFVSMSQLGPDPAYVISDPVSSPIKPEDRVELASIIGARMLPGADYADVARQAIEDMADRYEWSEGYAGKVGRYAEMLGTQEGRDRALNIPQVFEPARMVLREEPPLDYSPERLVRAVSSGEIKSHIKDDLRETLIDRINSGDPLAIEDCRHDIKEVDLLARNLDALSFYPPYMIAMAQAKELKQNPLPFETYAQQLHRKYAKLFSDGRRYGMWCGKPVRVAINRAITQHFGLRNFERDTYEPFEKQLSDAMMRDDHRRAIIGKAEIEILRNCDQWPELHGVRALFRQQLSVPTDAAA